MSFENDSLDALAQSVHQMTQEAKECNLQLAKLTNFLNIIASTLIESSGMTPERKSAWYKTLNDISTSRTK
jgi:hypothetical protein